MSGSFNHSKCPTCKGTGEIPTAGDLYNDLQVCSYCDGDGVLYEYQPNETLYPFCQTSHFESVCPVRK